MPSEPDDLSLPRAMQAAGISFVVFGGHAVIMHGYRRTTDDTDVIWIRTPESEKKLLAVLTSFNAKYIGKEIDPATRIEKTYPVTLPYIRSQRIMMLWSDIGFLDLFDFVFGFNDVDPNELLESAFVVDGIPIVSKRWLYKMKEHADRTKDKADVEYLKKLDAQLNEGLGDDNGEE